MVMSASGDDPDGPSEDAEVLDWSFQNKTNALLRAAGTAAPPSVAPSLTALI